MKRIILILLLGTAAAQADAQQLQTSSLYDLQGSLHNPSVAGTSEYNFIGASYRTQWTGISGAPRTANVFASYGMPEHHIGIGAYLYSDKTGPTSRTGIQVAFAKHIPMKNGGNFSLGIEARGTQFGIDREKLTGLGADPVLAGGDNKFKFDAGFGISYTDKKLQLGASVSQLVQSKLDFYTGNLTPTEEGRLYRHYYFNGSYKLFAGTPVTVTPNFLLIYLPNAPMTSQFGVKVEHNEVFWWGMGLRLKQSILLNAGVNINKQFTIGYAYDIYKTPVSTFNGGADAHEILLRFNFAKSK